jgi:hypothetical protein
MQKRTLVTHSVSKPRIGRARTTRPPARTAPKTLHPKGNIIRGAISHIRPSSRAALIWKLTMYHPNVRNAAP